MESAVVGEINSARVIEKTSRNSMGELENILNITIGRALNMVATVLSETFYPLVYDVTVLI